METKVRRQLYWFRESTAPPHSLGKLIEWKHYRGRFSHTVNSFSPHSLGKLIEWKLKTIITAPAKFVLSASPLVGKLIEWKLIDVINSEFV
jgi:hypothetical protein